MTLTEREVANIAQAIVERDPEPPASLEAIAHFLSCDFCALGVQIMAVYYEALLETPIDSGCRMAAEFELERRFRKKMSVLI